MSETKFEFAFEWFKAGMSPYSVINVQTAKPLIAKMFADAGYDVRIRNLNRNFIDYIVIEQDNPLSFTTEREYKMLVLRAIDYWAAFGTYKNGNAFYDAMRAGCEILEAKGLDTVTARLLLKEIDAA